jgi:septum formation protein
MLESPSVTEKPLLILASNSPRRHQLLALAGWKFKVAAADVDESITERSPPDYVLRLAETWARRQADADQIILRQTQRL